MDEADLFLLAAADVARLCTHSRSTWWRWRRGATRAPLSVRSLLRIVVAGELPQGGETWQGWRFFRGKLFDPDGRGHTPETIQAWYWLAQRLQAMRASENTARDLPANVTELMSARPAHALTEELHRRLGESK